MIPVASLTAKLKRWASDPRQAIAAVGARSRDAYRATVPDADARRFIDHNRRMWNGWAPRKSDRIVLADLWGIGESNLVRSYFLNALARRHRAEIRTFSSPRTRPRPSVQAVYRSFNTAGNIVTRLDREQAARRDAIARDVLPGLESKADVLGLTVLGIGVGIDIYETYLRRYKQATVALDDPRFVDTVTEGIGLVLFWKDFFARHDVAAVIASHDCYLEFDVVCKVAFASGVAVYLPSVRGIWHVDRPHAAWSSFARYRDLFATLSPADQHAGRAIARRQLERRLSGEIAVDMPYTKVSAFRRSGGRGTALRGTARTRVLVCTPCFTDNPHAYGGLLHVDFYEWLRHVARVAQRTDFDWYVKTHPDPLPVTVATVDAIAAEFPRLTVIPKDTSHQEIVEAGVRYVLTPYGSVGHEYPALGVPVVNAGYNPRAAYDFNVTPKSVEDYEACLLSLPDLRVDIVPEDLEEFYYVHHYYTVPDDLVLPSWRQSLLDLSDEQRNGTAVYGYFLDRLSSERHRQIVDNIERFLESGKAHYYSRGPE